MLEKIAQVDELLEKTKQIQTEIQELLLEIETLLKGLNE